VGMATTQTTTSVQKVRPGHTILIDGHDTPFYVDAKFTYTDNAVELWLGADKHDEDPEGVYFDKTDSVTIVVAEWDSFFDADNK